MCSCSRTALVELFFLLLDKLFNLQTVRYTYHSTPYKLGMGCKAFLTRNLLLMTYFKNRFYRTV